MHTIYNLIPCGSSFEYTRECFCCEDNVVGPNLILRSALPKFMRGGVSSVVVFCLATTAKISSIFFFVLKIFEKSAIQHCILGYLDTTHDREN